MCTSAPIQVTIRWTAEPLCTIDVESVPPPSGVIATHAITELVLDPETVSARTQAHATNVALIISIPSSIGRAPHDDPTVDLLNEPTGFPASIIGEKVYLNTTLVPSAARLEVTFALVFTVEFFEVFRRIEGSEIDFLILIFSWHELWVWNSEIDV